MLRSRTTLLLLLLALFALASTSANALGIRVNSATIGHDDGAGGTIFATIDGTSFSDFDLDGNTIKDFWLGNSATNTHIGTLAVSNVTREWRMQDSNGTLLDPTFPYSNGTSDIVLTLGPGGVATSNTLYVESYTRHLVFGPDANGEDFSFALSTDGSTFPRGGPSNNIGCMDADVGGGFFDMSTSGATIPTGSAFTNGLNLGSTGTLVAIGCYFREENSFEVPFVMTLDVEVVVPEPSTALLLAGGLGGIAWFGRRRR